MVYFTWIMGGKVSICSRSGLQEPLCRVWRPFGSLCGNFTRNYGYNGQHTQQPREESYLIRKTNQAKRGQRIYRNRNLSSCLFCPIAVKALSPMICWNSRSGNGEEGILILSPYDECLSSKSTVFLPEDKVVGDLPLPHCDHSLILHDNPCDKSGLRCQDLGKRRTKLIEFYICTMKGCKWHGLSRNEFFMR